jgi:hypothetical protein
MSDHKPANPPPPPPAFPKSEEMVDPWASLPPQPSASGGKPVATSMWGPPAAVVTRPVDAKLDEAITPDGHVNMSCFVPVGVGAVTGALGGQSMRRSVRIDESWLRWRSETRAPDAAHRNCFVFLLLSFALVQAVS